jgi:hypothetical protein
MSNTIFDIPNIPSATEITSAQVCEKFPSCVDRFNAALRDQETQASDNAKRGLNELNQGDGMTVPRAI